MQTIQLSRTGLTVSRACFGTMTFGSQTAEDAAARMIGVCAENGINFLDTANIYNDGLSEEILGRILQGQRGKFVLASKVRGKMSDGTEGLSREHMLRSVEASLRRLRTDHLDLCYLHFPDYLTPLEETLATMDQLVREGKVRFPAFSNYAAWQVTRMLWLADSNGWQPALISQPMYNLLARGIEQEYLPMCKEFGVATVVYNPLAGGMLTGKQPADAPLAGTRFDNNRMYLDRYWHPQQFAAIAELRQAASAAGRTLTSVALNWLLHHSAADCVILGASRVEQLEENLKAMEEGPLTQETVGICDAVWRGLRGITPRYNR